MAILTATIDLGEGTINRQFKNAEVLSYSNAATSSFFKLHFLEDARVLKKLILIIFTSLLVASVEG